MLSLDEGKKAIEFIRLILSATIYRNHLPEMKLSQRFTEAHGVFTTLHTFPNHTLRGCIGVPESIMPLKEAIIKSAKSVIHDPRFPVLQANELDNLVVEITILSKPEIISKQDNDVVKGIIVGKHGLIIEQGFYKGLLLPQVPVEQNWDSKSFIEHTCLKAGLPKDAWLDKNTVIKKFTGQIFTEEKPFGKIREKTFDEA